jgi:small redox-active disulfide protein 2
MGIFRVPEGPLPEEEIPVMKFQVLGTGCPKCQLLTAHTEAAAAELGLPYALEKVTDINAIIGFGVLATPALVVDGEVKVSGKVPSVEALKELLAPH